MNEATSEVTPKQKPGLRSPVTKHEVRLARRHNELVLRHKHLMREAKRTESDLDKSFIDLVSAGMVIGNDGEPITIEKLVEAQEREEAARQQPQAMPVEATPAPAE